MTGQQASTGKQIEAAVKLYMAQHGDTVAGKKIEVILKDDGAVPDNTKRLAQELVVNDKVSVLAGFGITPAALAVAPLATQAKVPLSRDGGRHLDHHRALALHRAHQLHAAAVVRDDGRLGGQERHQEGRDHGLRLRARRRCREVVQGALQGRRRRGRRGAPGAAASPDFAPFLQRAADAKPDALFVFVPSGQGGTFIKQFVERGLDKAGIKLIGPGDVTDDDLLNGMGDAVLGVVTAHNYSADHPSAMNKAYVEAFKKANDVRPNFMSVGGYDGMHLIYEALKKTDGEADGDTLIAAMKGMAWESPRGPISIDPETRDIVQNIYIRKVEKKGRRALQRRVRDLRGRQGPGEGRRSKQCSDAWRRAAAAVCRRRAFRRGARRAHMLTILFDGVAYGMLLFVLACGLAVTLGLMNFVNLAHGAFAMAGGYCTVILVNRWGVPFLAGLPLAFLVSAALGLVLERTLYVHVYRKPPSRPGAVLDRPRVHGGGRRRLRRWARASSSCGCPAGCRASSTCSASASDATGCSSSSSAACWRWRLQLVLSRTRFGSRLRAAVDDARVARGLGINVDARLRRSPSPSAPAWPASAARWAPRSSASIPTFPLKFMIYFLIVVTVGGTSSITGPFLASLLLGIADVAGKYYVPTLGAFVIYTVMIVVLIWRPQGLFARGGAR